MKLKIKLLPKQIQAMAAIIIVLVVGIFVGVRLAASDKPEQEIVTSSTLTKIINISKLSTYRTVYNGVAKAMDEKSPDKVDYYVAYQATVEAGIDFTKTDITVDDQAKTVVITLPEVTITDIAVDSTTLDYIFVDKSAETSSVSGEALQLCKADVEQETADQDGILKLARQNAQNVVEALTRPLVAQSNPDYTLTVQ